MRELGVTQVFARSPEAKGRIERANGTFQDRLVAELRLAGISTLEEANRFLQNSYPATTNILLSLLLNLNQLIVQYLQA